MKKILTLLPFSALLALSSAFAEDENILKDASFESYTEGSAIGQPWRIRAEGTQTAVTASRPEGDASKDWVYVKDMDGNEKVYLYTEFAPISKGTLSFRFFFPTMKATSGIYLRNSNLDKSQNNIVELKTLETSGNIYVGSNGQRERLPIELLSTGYYSLDLVFDATDAGEKIEVYIKDDTGRHLIHSMVSPDAHPVDTLMITTDTSTSNSEFYVGDIRLTQN